VIFPAKWGGLPAKWGGPSRQVGWSSRQVGWSFPPSGVVLPAGGVVNSVKWEGKIYLLSQNEQAIPHTEKSTLRVFVWFFLQWRAQWLPGTDLPLQNRQCLFVLPPLVLLVLAEMSDFPSSNLSLTFFSRFPTDSFAFS
jgi:hypothetical protein